jgi:3-isopropylmalate dehydrogenase
MQRYQITLLAGDGIGPEIMDVAVKVLTVIGDQFDLQFEFESALMGGSAIDAVGEPLPAATLEACRRSGIRYRDRCALRRGCWR